MELTDEEILSTISEHTSSEAMRLAHWLRNIRYNEENFGFRKTLADLPASPWPKGLVLGAGPAFKRLGMKPLVNLLNTSKVTVFACDGALPTLAETGYAPDYVTSVDAHPVVANFYRRCFDLLNWGSKTKFLLSTTVHKDVVDTILDSGSHRDDIYWWQPFWPDELEPAFRRHGLTQLNTGGNVGTTSYIIAAVVQKLSPIGLMGLEFSWSDETPLVDTQYFAQIMKVVGEDPKKARKMFKVVKNERDGKNYVADPVYYAYWLMFKELWGLLPSEVRDRTYNLTREGILDAPGLRTITTEGFAKL